MSKKKRSIMRYMLQILLGFFLIWNIVWSVNFYTYYKFSSGYMKSPVSYIKSGKDYTYTVACPRYLSFTGNFALTNNDNLSIIIWPAIFMLGNSEYGAGIYDEMSDSTYRFYVDEDLKYLYKNEMGYSDSEEKTIQILLGKYQKDLHKMRRLAYDEWNIEMTDKPDGTY